MKQVDSGISAKNSAVGSSSIIDGDSLAFKVVDSSTKGEGLRKYPKQELDSNYSFAAVSKRQKWLSQKLGKSFPNLFSMEKDYSVYKSNIENPIGMLSVPVALVGPVLVSGDYAKGDFYVPFATTQGTLVESYQRGSALIKAAGGAYVKCVSDKIDLDPVFVFSNLNEAHEFFDWVRHQLDLSFANEVVRKHTRHGRVVGVVPFLFGKRVFLQVECVTDDAMGLNIMSIALHYFCEKLREKFPNCVSHFMRSNLSSDKKSSHLNMISAYGKEVHAEITIPNRLVQRFLHVTSKMLCDFWHSCMLATYQGGVLGHNAHVANGVGAIYLATGQDIAQLPNVSTAFTNFELTESGDLYVGIKLFSLPVATVGGGTSCPVQRESLEILGCYGEGGVKKFSEIIAATLLAGELSLMGVLAQNAHAHADIRLKERSKQ